MAEKENVLVVVRCRPFSDKEKLNGHLHISSIDDTTGVIKLLNPKNNEDTKTFTFDQAFDESCTQQGVYNKTAKPIVDGILF
jgi:DNA polymerase II small subunit/DNA polymerase delta subunit B